MFLNTTANVFRFSSEKRAIFFLSEPSGRSGVRLFERSMEARGKIFEEMEKRSLREGVVFLLRPTVKCE